MIPIIENTRFVHWKYVEATSDGDVEIKTMNTDRIDMREHVLDFGKQKVITKDNVMINIDALVYFRISDPKAATFNVANLPDAVELLVQVGDCFVGVTIRLLCVTSLPRLLLMIPSPPERLSTRNFSRKYGILSRQLLVGSSRC